VPWWWLKRRLWYGIATLLVLFLWLVSKSSMTSDMLHRTFHWSKCKLTPSFVGTVPFFQNRKSTFLDPFHSVNSGKRAKGVQMTEQQPKISQIIDIE
jgi:hypothetical protein